jgi:hypothetical protein
MRGSIQEDTTEQLTSVAEAFTRLVFYLNRIVFSLLFF